MGYTLLAGLVLVGLFFGMLLLLEIGRRLALRRLKKEPAGAVLGVGPVVGAIFSLLGLLIAFTFSGASARFDARRQLIVQERNAMDNAYHLLDVLPDRVQATALKDDFRKYLDTELEATRRLPDVRAAEEALVRCTVLQEDIRKQILVAYQDGKGQAAASILLPAVTQWIQFSTARTFAAETHTPVAIFVMLGAFALTSALVAGYGMAEGKSRSWLHILVFPAVITATLYVIADLEFPRVGLIRLDAADQSLTALRERMK
ncbi:MAG TPA: hypothetical protein VGD78_08205 [Chthoniobacterales bacterium]